MDDTRIERALRQGPPGESTYRPQLHRSSIAAHVGRRRGGQRPLAMAAGAIRMVATAFVVIIAIGGLLWLRPRSVPPVAATPSPSVEVSASPPGSGDLLAQVRASGALRLAIRPDFPQATILGLEGFDVDVGTELATRLGLTGNPIQLLADEILSNAGTDTWDVALPSALLTADDAARFATSEAYYYWPVRLLVPVASTVTATGELAGRRICVVVGSSGEAWLAGQLPASADPVVQPPSSVVARTAASDGDCLDAVTSGDAVALVTRNLSDSDLAARPSFRTVGGPLFIEPRTIVAARAGLDPSALVSAIDDALGAMRSDGTLADLSRNRFGGRDLSTPPGTT